jgi:HK97 family phage major capsid protein
MADLRSTDELQARESEIRTRLEQIDSEHAGEALPDPVREEWNQLNAERDELKKTIDELETRKARIEELSGKGNGEAGAHFHVARSGVPRGEDVFDLSTVRASATDPATAGAELRDRARRALDMARLRHPDVDEARAKRNVEAHIDGDTLAGDFSRHLLVTGSPQYKRDFGEYVRTGNPGRLAERALSLTAGNGGYAVPYELDPTILATSNGVVNPIRQLARVEQITVDEWRGVASAGITAAYAAEATETTDNSPTLTQPTVSTEKAQAFIPFSIEIGQDWSSLQQQMAVLLQDAKDTLESAKFVSGSGTNEPFGVITGTTNTVNATSPQTFDLGDLYSLVAALPPRYRSNAAFMGDLQILNLVRQFDTVGSSAAIWQDTLQADTPARLLGKPVYEASDMADTPATGNKFLLFGDFSRYLIVDRVGLSVEVIPHLFGANQRPTGQRGLYAYWRNGAKVIDANAFRVLLGVA